MSDLSVCLVCNEPACERWRAEQWRGGAWPGRAGPPAAAEPSQAGRLAGIRTAVTALNAAAGKCKWQLVGSARNDDDVFAGWWSAVIKLVLSIRYDSHCILPIHLR